MSYISGGEDGYCRDDNDRYEAGDDYHNDDGRYQELGMIITMIMIIIRQCQRRSTGLQGICHSCLSSFLLRATSIMKRFPDAIASPSLTWVKDAINRIGIYGNFSHKGGRGLPM